MAATPIDRVNVRATAAVTTLEQQLHFNDRLFHEALDTMRKAILARDQAARQLSTLRMAGHLRPVYSCDRCGVRMFIEPPPDGAMCELCLLFVNMSEWIYAFLGALEVRGLDDREVFRRLAVPASVLEHLRIVGRRFDEGL